MGLFGFELGLFSGSPEGWFIVVNLCGKEGCIDFVLKRIGFVWVCFGFVFSSLAGCFIFVSPCDKESCIDFGLVQNWLCFA